MKLYFIEISGSVFSGLDSDRGENVLDVGGGGLNDEEVDGLSAEGGDGLSAEGGDGLSAEGDGEDVLTNEGDGEDVARVGLAVRHEAVAAQDVMADQVGILVDSSAVNGAVRQVVQVKRGLSCSFCGATGINGMSKLMLHIDRMHSKSFTCSICKVEFCDRFNFMQHSPSCFYWCPVDGCSYHEKRESRFKGHLRKHRVL